ncbi:MULTISPECIES: lipase family protein [Bacillus cereus group]|uniref:lipase family protein n=1 Tax=Bacillus cereus group TaxID=86661 RepID=UPI001F58D26F|nr:lipase family protein [Bacillus cereus group sp. BfR-BA-01360]HDR4571461.1 lipase [Bacillus cytotoxicus]HDR4587273.1 lipase [Bacillus cytotoxicus]HDR7315099.1 lipase [Bacillus cytotoxicus]
MERYNLSSDEGKLQLAAKDIYGFNGREGDYDSKSAKINREKLESTFNCKIIDFEDDQITGFGAYALKDIDTGDITIVYVGTQPKQTYFGIGAIDSPDVWADASIGLNNLFNTDYPVRQYDMGVDFYERIKRNHGQNNNITLIGHSLGGGIANTVALRNQKDNIPVLTLNPAPVLNTDVAKYGDGSNMKNNLSIVNENDPLYGGIKVADFVIPGRVYMMLNGESHSYVRQGKYFDENKNLSLDMLKAVNDTGPDWTPAFFEVSGSAGNLYKGLTGKKNLSAKEEAIVDIVVNGTPVGALIFAITTAGDFSQIANKFESIKSTVATEAIKFSIAATIEIKSAVDTAVDWIETTLAKCKEKVLEVLESVFNAAVDFLAGSVNVYLAASEILEIAKEVAGSYIQDLLDMFKGDFQIDTNVTAIVAEHILAHRHSLLNLFMNDSSRGINRSLLGEISKDVKELSKDLKQLNEDVSEAVFSMMAKDEELGAVAYY